LNLHPINMVVDYDNDLVVITCASGKQGSHLILLVHGKWKRLRLAVNSSSSEEQLKKRYPDTEVVRGDMAIAADAARLLKGSTVVFYVGPSMHPREADCGFNMIEAAVAESKAGTFKHFVFSSVVNTQLRKLLNHDCKRLVEECLMESGLNYTILQPSHYFENTPVGILMQQEKPFYPMAYNPAIKFSFTSLRDMDEAAAVILDEREKHYFALYQIISTMPIAYTEFLSAIGNAMGKPIRVEQKPFEAAVEGLLQRFFPGREVDPTVFDTAERLLLYYNRRGILGNPSVLEMLIGRRATSCKEWAELQVKALKQA
jgi:uncharacterized protein YbjT (DUF2867 family)